MSARYEQRLKNWAIFHQNPEEMTAKELADRDRLTKLVNSWTQSDEPDANEIEESDLGTDELNSDKYHAGDRKNKTFLYVALSFVAAIIFGVLFAWLGS